MLARGDRYEYGSAFSEHVVYVQLSRWRTPRLHPPDSYLKRGLALAQQYCWSVIEGAQSYEGSFIPNATRLQPYFEACARLRWGKDSVADGRSVRAKFKAGPFLEPMNLIFRHAKRPETQAEDNS